MRRSLVLLALVSACSAFTANDPPAATVRDAGGPLADGGVTPPVTGDDSGLPDVVTTPSTFTCDSHGADLLCDDFEKDLSKWSIPFGPVELFGTQLGPAGAHGNSLHASFHPASGNSYALDRTLRFDFPVKIDKSKRYEATFRVFLVTFQVDQARIAGFFNSDLSSFHTYALGAFEQKSGGATNVVLDDSRAPGDDVSFGAPFVEQPLGKWHDVSIVLEGGLRTITVDSTPVSNAFPGNLADRADFTFALGWWDTGPSAAIGGEMWFDDVLVRSTP